MITEEAKVNLFTSVCLSSWEKFLKLPYSKYVVVPSSGFELGVTQNVAPSSGLK
jgi:hypothetical protein